MLSVLRHQAGWFPFNLENELQLPGDRANQDEAEGEMQNHDLQDMVAAVFLKKTNQKNVKNKSSSAPFSAIEKILSVC